MFSKAKLVLTFILGALIGTAAAQPLEAQVKGAAAYIITENAPVADQAAFIIAIQNGSTSMQGHGGHYLVRGANASAIAGTPPSRITIVAFDDVSKTKIYVNSAEFQKIVTEIQKSAPGTKTFLVEAQ